MHLDRRLSLPSQPEAAPAPIAVIGGGFAGTMVAVHLARKLPEGGSVLLCERAAFARGVAYAPSRARHLLNVRAENMSALAGDPGHFRAWLERAAEEVPEEVEWTEAGPFASRRLYGHYLEGLLNEHTGGPDPRVRLLPQEVVDLRPEGEGFRLVTADGVERRVAGAVLAIGNLAPPEAGSAVHCTNPWAPEATAGLRPGRPVLVIGTGLTMVDLVLEMHARGFAGPVIALSRRGLLSQPHAPAPAWPTPVFTLREMRSVRRLLRRVRDEVARAAAAGVDWRAVVDSLRPVTAELWHGLSRAERARFLRHLRPFWDVHRHRLAAPVAGRIAELRRSGYLEIRVGRIVEMTVGEGEAEVVLRRRGAGATERLTVQRIISATGLTPARDAASPLVSGLRRRGLVRLDPHGLGLDVSETLQVLDMGGRALPNLWALGPIVRGVFWECMAVPDIRRQAELVAWQAAQRLGELSPTVEAPALA